MIKPWVAATIYHPSSNSPELGHQLAFCLCYTFLKCDAALRNPLPNHPSHPPRSPEGAAMRVCVLKSDTLINNFLLKKHVALDLLT